jgi:hypothetical protein
MIAGDARSILERASPATIGRTRETTMQRITITAGTGEDRHGNALPAQTLQQALASIRAKLAHTFGGYTERESLGGWINSAGILITEPGRQWIALTDKSARDADPLADDVAAYVRDALLQQSVMVESETVLRALRRSDRSHRAAS